MLQCLNKNHPQIKQMLNIIPSEFMLSSILSKYPNDYTPLQFELVNSSNDLFNTKLINISDFNNSLQTTNEEVQTLINDISNRFDIDIFVDNKLPVAGRYENGRIYINMNKADVNTLFHELAHPIVQMIKELDNENYENLLSELYTNPYGIELLNRAKELYSDKDLSIQEEEALVELVANYSSGKLLTNINEGAKLIKNNVSLFSKLKLLLKEFSKMFINLFANKNNKMVKELNNNLGIHKLANTKSIAEVVQLLKYGTNVKLRTSYKLDNINENKVLQTKLSKQTIESIMQMFKEGNSIEIQGESYHKDNIDVIVVDNITDSYKQLSELTGARLVNTKNEVVYIPFNSRVKDSYDSRFDEIKKEIIEKLIPNNDEDKVLFTKYLNDKTLTGDELNKLQEYNNNIEKLEEILPNIIMMLMENSVNSTDEVLRNNLYDSILNTIYSNYNHASLLERLNSMLAEVKYYKSFYLSDIPQIIEKYISTLISHVYSDFYNNNMDVKSLIKSELDLPIFTSWFNYSKSNNEENDYLHYHYLSYPTFEIINESDVYDNDNEDYLLTRQAEIEAIEELNYNDNYNENEYEDDSLEERARQVDENSKIFQDNVSTDKQLIEEFTEEPIEKTEKKLYDWNTIDEMLKQRRLDELNKVKNKKQVLLNNIREAFGLKLEQLQTTKNDVKELIQNNEEVNTVNEEIKQEPVKLVDENNELTEEVKEVINQTVNEEIDKIVEDDSTTNDEQTQSENTINEEDIVNDNVEKENTDNTFTNTNLSSSRRGLTIRDKTNTNFIFMGTSQGFKEFPLFQGKQLRNFNSKLEDVNTPFDTVLVFKHDPQYYGPTLLPRTITDEVFIIEKKLIKGVPTTVFNMYKFASEAKATRPGCYYGASIISQDGLELNYENCVKVLRKMMSEIENQLLVNKNGVRFKNENGVRDIKYNNPEFIENITNALDLEIFTDQPIQIPNQSLYKMYDNINDFTQDNSSATKIIKLDSRNQNQFSDSFIPVQTTNQPTPDQSPQIDSQSTVDNSATIEDTSVEQQFAPEETVSNSKDSAGITNSPKVNIKIEEYIEEKVKEELETRRKEIENSTLDIQAISQFDEKEKIVYEELDRETKDEIKQTFKTKGLTFVKKLTKYITNFITGGFLFKPNVDKKIKQDIKSIKLQGIVKSILNKLKRTGKYILFLITTYGVVFSTNIYNDVNAYPISFSNLINNTSKNAQFVIELLPEVYQQQALRGLNKIGLYDVEEETVTVLPSYTKLPDNTSQTENKLTSNNYSFYKEYQKVKDNFKGSGQTDSLYVYERQSTNEEGFIYIPGPTIKNSKSDEKINKVSGVGHFLITYENTDLTNNTSDLKLKVEKNRILEQYKNQNPNGWIPVFKKLNKGVTLSFKKLNEINEEDIVMTRLYQRNFGDLDFEQYKKSNKLVGGKKSIMDTNKNQSVDQLQFTKKDAYGRLSGGSAIFIFNVNGQTIIREAAGSVNFLEQVGKNIANQYNLDKKDITMGFFDAGSYAAKPASYKDNITIDQYRGYGSSTSTGAALMIPTLELQQELSTIESKLINNNQIKPTCRL